jgi:ribosomal protein S3AE
MGGLFWVWMIWIWLSCGEIESDGVWGMGLYIVYKKRGINLQYIKNKSHLTYQRINNIITVDNADMCSMTIFYMRFTRYKIQNIQE